MKKNFAEPEMEVVRFSAQEILTASSGSPFDDCGYDSIAVCEVRPPN